jgi:hypothetical protein
MGAGRPHRPFHTNDPYTELEPGDEGTVEGYRPLVGQLVVDWDSGCRLVLWPDAGDIVERL